MALTTSEQIVAKIEALILANPLASSISLDGHSVSLRDAKAELEYWRRRVANEKGTRPATVGVDLSGQ